MSVGVLSLKVTPSRTKAFLSFASIRTISSGVFGLAATLNRIRVFGLFACSVRYEGSAFNESVSSTWRGLEYETLSELLPVYQRMIQRSLPT